MKSLDLLRAVGQIDEKYIDEADALQEISVQPASGSRSARAARRRRFAAAAACLVVVAGAGVYAVSSRAKYGAAPDNMDLSPVKTLPSASENIVDKIDTDDRSVSSALQNSESASPDVELQLGYLDKDSGGAGFTVQNNSAGAIEIGEDFRLLREKEGEWQELPYVGNAPAWDAVAHSVEAGSSMCFVLSLENVYGELKAGKYRLVKTFRTGSGEASECMCEFIVD